MTGHNRNRHARHKVRPKTSPTPAVKLERDARQESDDTEAREELKTWQANKKKL